MLVLITYEAPASAEGRKRLRQVSKECQEYGQRVQSSVFECVMDYGAFLKLRKGLLTIIDSGEDSLRFYLLGHKWKGKIEHYGY